MTKWDKNKAIPIYVCHSIGNCSKWSTVNLLKFCNLLKFDFVCLYIPWKVQITILALWKAQEKWKAYTLFRQQFSVDLSARSERQLRSFFFKLTEDWISVFFFCIFLFCSVLFFQNEDLRMEDIMGQAHEFLRNFSLSNPQNQSLLHKHLDLFLTPGVRYL